MFPKRFNAVYLGFYHGHNDTLWLRSHFAAFHLNVTANLRPLHDGRAPDRLDSHACVPGSSPAETNCIKGYLVSFRGMLCIMYQGFRIICTCLALFQAERINGKFLLQNRLTFALLLLKGTPWDKIFSMLSILKI